MVALIAALDEEASLADVLTSMPTQSHGLGIGVLVVDDGSTDSTAQVARRGGARVARFDVNLGHGRALRFGYRLAIERGARYIVTLDADGQNDPAEMGALLDPILNDDADFVIASRRLGRDETTNRLRASGVVVFALLTSTLTGTYLSDTSNGYRALRAEVVEQVLDHLIQDQYQTAELLLHVLRRGWRVRQVAATWHPRSAGESKKGSDLAYGLRYARVLFDTWWRTRKLAPSRSLASS